jgi:hypothetical protein
MKNEQYIHQKVDETLASLDDAKQATPTPFLFTRVMARLQAAKETSWEKIGRLISRPSFAVAGLTTLIILNVMVLTFQHSKAANINMKAQQTLQVATNYFSSNEVSSIDNNENTTP